MATTVRELAALCGAAILDGDPETVIHGAANTDEAQTGELTFIASPRYVAKLAATRASTVIVPQGLDCSAARPGTALLASTDPEIAFIVALRHLYPQKRLPDGVSPRADVDVTATLGPDCRVAAFASVGADSRIGKGCQIHAGCRIGAGVTIGDHCVLHPNVVLYDGVTLGDRATIHAGTVIGSDGYGYKFRDGQHVKFPQVGSVVIGSDVEIGANTCIDRAALGETRIGDGTKIDNQVHIAHNVQIGRGVLLLGQVGIGGSTVIEDYALLASQCGVSDHVTVGARAIVLAQAGVTKDVAPKDQVMGFPAENRRAALHHISTLRKIASRAKAIEELVDLLPALRDGSTGD